MVRGSEYHKCERAQHLFPKQKLNNVQLLTGAGGDCKFLRSSIIPA